RSERYAHAQLKSAGLADARRTALAAARPGAEPPAEQPLLITDEDSTRAIAVENPTFRSEPFATKSLIPWSLDSNDRQTRIALLTMNLGASFGDSAESVNVDAEDINHNHYSLAVEYLGEVPAYPWLTQVIVRLNENLSDTTGDVLISIGARGLRSNRARIGIGYVGDGPPDDSLPTPAPAKTGAQQDTLPMQATISGFELHD